MRDILLSDPPRTRKRARKHDRETIYYIIHTL